MDGTMVAPAMAVSAVREESWEANAPTKTFTHDWYIRVKLLFQDTPTSSLTPQITDLEQKVTLLHSALQAKLNVPGIQLLPQRFKDESEERSDQKYVGYWVICLPTIGSAEISEVRKIARAWEVKIGEGKVPKRKLQAKFVKREVILLQNLQPYIGLLTDGFSLTAGNMTKPETRRTGESFKKVQGSSPAQIRKQFLQHAMGGEASEVLAGKGKGSGGKLRPPKDVLNRLKYDDGYDVEEYVVGYIDRQAGILEKPVAEWQEYEEQELIAYFKYAPRNETVWDRARKVDLVFSQRPGRC